MSSNDNISNETSNSDNFKLKNNAYGYHSKECSDNYAKGRPTYPVEVIDFIKGLGVNSDSVIVDLAAGTGKFTQLLASSFNNITAVEPSPEFREQCNIELEKVKNEINPLLNFKVLQGLSTSIPLDDNSVDCLSCATSFHWFSNIESIKEISRVLKPNGLLLIVWNRPNPDPNENPINILDATISLHKNPKYNNGNKSPTSILVEKWRDVFDKEIKSSPTLQELINPNLQKSPSILNVQTTWAEKIISQSLSMSYMALLPPIEKQNFINDLKQNLESFELTSNNKQFTINYSTDIFFTRKPQNL